MNEDPSGDSSTSFGSYDNDFETVSVDDVFHKLNSVYCYNILYSNSVMVQHHVAIA